VADREHAQVNRYEHSSRDTALDQLARKSVLEQLTASYDAVLFLGQASYQPGDVSTVRDLDGRGSARIKTGCYLPPNLIRVGLACLGTDHPRKTGPAWLAQGARGGTGV
jgi:hypothetical protein